MENQLIDTIQKTWAENDMFHEGHFDVCYFDIDGNKKMHLSSILQLMMETSIRHIIKLGLSYWDTKHLNLTWLFRRGRLIIHRVPSLNDRIHVKSYASYVNKFFTQRDYLMTDADGNIMADFSTEWILFNFKTRRPCRIEESVGPLPISPDVKPLPSPNFKIRIEGDHLLTDSYIVRGHDIDFNGHVNNVCYSRWINESIPPDFQNNRQVSDYFVEVKNETLLGEKVYIDHYAESNLALRHVIRNEQGDKIYCLARSEFRP